MTAVDIVVVGVLALFGVAILVWAWVAVRDFLFVRDAVRALDARGLAEHEIAGTIAKWKERADATGTPIREVMREELRE